MLTRADNEVVSTISGVEQQQGWGVPAAIVEPYFTRIQRFGRSAFKMADNFTINYGSNTAVAVYTVSPGSKFFPLHVMAGATNLAQVVISYLPRGASFDPYSTSYSTEYLGSGVIPRGGGTIVIPLQGVPEVWPPNAAGGAIAITMRALYEDTNTKGLVTAYALLQELITDYVAHCALVGAPACHSAADAVNNSPAALASTLLPDMCVSANSLKAQYNAHDAEFGAYHAAAGTAHQTAAANAYDLGTLLTLVNELRTNYEAHRVDDNAHGLIDSTNIISNAAAAASSAMGNAVIYGLEVAQDV
jgi:hypothetical protein